MTNHMRRKTIPVKIGRLTLSSESPVMVQSMLNTPTMDTLACVEQAIRIIEAGGELVRITAPGVREAENLKNIRAELHARGYDTPLSADIHFTPDAAMVAAQYVEKVRINPGNFVDKRATFRSLTYTDEEYAAELEVLREKFTAFLEVCRRYGTAVRIGTNHGSLSDRIMSRYGDTPAGMVESTMEYLRVCREVGFEAVVISLKSSDCRVMVDAVRLLVQAMEKEGMAYPLHLGVTEAGEGEDGRIRSAVGIGTLLNEGIGDTIRVSLTEEPEAEIPVAEELVRLCAGAEYEPGGDGLKGEAVRPEVVTGLPDASSVISMDSPEALDEALADRLAGDRQAVVVLAFGADYRAYREAYRRIRQLGIKNKTVVHLVLEGTDRERLALAAAAHVGGLFLDRLPDGLWITMPDISDTDYPVELAKNIFQSAGVRRYKAEFISCPGCGRTLFDLQGAVARVKAAFAHLDTLKIAVMGCVVNGPGEMGDADYGYVGAGNGKVNLYRGRRMVRAAVPEAEAIEALHELIAAGEQKNI